MSRVGRCVGPNEDPRGRRDRRLVRPGVARLLHAAQLPLGFGIDLSAAARIVAPRRVGEPSTAGSVLTSRAANRGTSAGREHYILLFLVGDTGIEAVASSVSKEARSH